MRFMRVALLVLSVLALTPSPAAAADFRTGDSVVVGANDAIEDDLYAFAGTISILGTVRGDVIAAGGNISVDGTITGDLIAAGNFVTIRGIVGGSVRATGASVTIDGRVGDDLVIGGGDLTILANGRVGRDVLVGSGSATLSGQVARDVQAGSGTLKIDGPVGRDVIAQAERIELTSRAAIEGSLTYTSAAEAILANGATVKGRTEHRIPASGPPEVTQGPAGLVVDWLKGLVGLLILGVFVVFFFPGFSRRAGEALVHSPWLTLAIGFIMLVGLPILAICFFIIGAIVGGWWLGFVVLAAYIVVIALAVPVAAVGLGGSILRITQRPAPVALALIIGLVVLLLIGIVPILGFAFILLAILFGLGATTRAIVGGRSAEPAAA